MVFLTSIVGEVAKLSWLQSLPHGSHPPRAPEKHVSPRAQSAQLLHASFFGPPILEPNLFGRREK